MNWSQFWQVSTITFFVGMATGVWLGMRRHRIPPVPTVANVTPSTTAELHAGVFTQSDDDDEPRPLQVGDEITLYPIIGGWDAIRAMFDPHNPTPPPGPHVETPNDADSTFYVDSRGLPYSIHVPGTFTPTTRLLVFGEEDADG